MRAGPMHASSPRTTPSAKRPVTHAGYYAQAPAPRTAAPQTSTSVEYLPDGYEAYGAGQGYAVGDWMEGGDPYAYFGGDDAYGVYGGGCDDACCDHCGEDCSGHCRPLWFVEADVLALRRSTAHREYITYTPVLRVVQGFPFIVDFPLQSTRTFVFNFEPGLRVNIGRNLGTDLLNRDHTLEFMYYGLQEWDASHQIVSDLADSFLPDAMGNVVPVTFGRLFSPFPLEVGAFNRAEVHHIQNWSNFNNFEVNYRIRRRVGRDRLVAWPDGSWTSEPATGWTPSMLLGVRYIAIDDHFRWTSSGSINNLDTGVSSPMLGRYNTDTSNDLLGLQIGGDLTFSWRRFSLGARGKAGLFGNYAQQTTHLSTQDDFGIFDLPQRDYEVTGQRMSFVGEFGFVGKWQMTPNLALRATYDFLWVQGMALAPEQLAFNLSAPPRVNQSGYMFFQGVGLGCEFCW